jgi:hypothetical protein
VAVIAALGLFFHGWSMRDNLIDLRIAQGGNRRALGIAHLRIAREACSLFTCLTLWCLAIAVIMFPRHPATIILLILTFFDYPLMSLVIAGYNHWLRRRMLL